MSRRPTLPGADELFRRTDPLEAGVATAPAVARPDDADDLPGEAVGHADAAGGARTVRPAGRRRGRAERRPSGRERHEEKITVYVSPEELLDLEHAKLTLRAQHGLAVDRGRIVREAVAFLVADLEASGDDSILVRRLRGL